MSAIRVVYEEEPSFPASEQHPAAKRYRVGAHWVDAIGGEPTAQDVVAFLNPVLGQIQEIEHKSRPSDRFMREFILSLFNYAKSQGAPVVETVPLKKLAEAEEKIKKLMGR